jgi:NADH-ubiquinone oxidoreductase chain 5
MFCLAILSIFVGYLFSDLFLGLGSFIWLDINFIKLNNHTNIEIIADFLSPVIKNLPLFFSICGCIFSYFFIFYNLNNYLNYYNYTYSLWYYLSNFFFNGFFFNYIYDHTLIFLLKKFYYVFSKNLDKGFLDMIGPYGFFKFFRTLSINFLFLDSSFFFSNISRTLIYLLILTVLFLSSLIELLLVGVLMFLIFS